MRLCRCVAWVCVCSVFVQSTEATLTDKAICADTKASLTSTQVPPDDSASFAEQFKRMIFADQKKYLSALRPARQTETVEALLKNGVSYFDLLCLNIPRNNPAMAAHAKRKGSLRHSDEAPRSDPSTSLNTSPSFSPEALKRRMGDGSLRRKSVTFVNSACVLTKYSGDSSTTQPPQSHSCTCLAATSKNDTQGKSLAMRPTHHMDSLTVARLNAILRSRGFKRTAPLLQRHTQLTETHATVTPAVWSASCMRCALLAIIVACVLATLYHH